MPGESAAAPACGRLTAGILWDTPLPYNDPYDPREAQAAGPGAPHPRPGRGARACPRERGRLRRGHAPDRRDSGRRHRPDGGSGRGPRANPSGESAGQRRRARHTGGRAADRRDALLFEMSPTLMSNLGEADFTHRHVFLGAGHVRNERRTWAVIALCTVMMVAEIVGGAPFGPARVGPPAARA